MQNSTVLITGVAGFLGRHLAREFHQAGMRVAGCDSGSFENAPSEFLNAYTSCLLPDGIEAIIKEERPSILIHCAGRASVPRSLVEPHRDYLGNAVLPAQILEMLRKHRPDCRFILLSSAAVYGNPGNLPVKEGEAISPISPYGFHKRQAELSCLEYSLVFGMRTVSCRIFSAYGPGLRRQVLWDLLNKCCVQDVIRLQGTGDETRDFIHARDVARAIRLICEHGEMRGESINIASGLETSILELTRQIVLEAGREKRIEFDGHLPHGVPTRWVADISRIKSLGFQPAYDISSGVREYVQWALPLVD